MVDNDVNVPKFQLSSMVLTMTSSEQPGQPPLPPPPPPWLQAAEPNAPPPPQQPQAAEARISPQQPQTAEQSAPPQSPPSQPQAAEQGASPPPPQPDIQQLAERKIREYRYRTRILKAMFLPIIFSLMSVLMLVNYVNTFEPYFGYNMEIILMGFIIGSIFMSGFVIANMRFAKRDGKYPARQRYSVFIILAFLVPYVYLMFFVNPAQAWRFSIGYFLSAIITPIVVVAFEAQANGKFYIQEEEVDDRLTRNLVFRP